MAFDEENIDPHGECAAAIHRLQEQFATARGEADFLRREYANTPSSHALEKLVAEAQASERERCAKVAYERRNDPSTYEGFRFCEGYSAACRAVAKAIRALSPTPNHEACSAAAPRSQAEANVLAVRSWDAPGFEACVKAEMEKMKSARSAISPMQVQHAIAAWNRLPEGARVEDRMKAALETLGAFPSPSALREEGVTEDAIYAVAYQRGEAYWPRLEYRGDGAWAIVDCGFVLSRKNEWEPEPQPSSRDQKFMERCRWGTAEAKQRFNALADSASALSPKGGT
jgi:hypothetical protein